MSKDAIAVSTRLPSELVEALEIRAAEQSRTRSSMVAIIVAEALAEAPDPAKETEQ
jgi:hypothetical protein